MASDCIRGDWRRHLRASFLLIKRSFLTGLSLLQQERLKLLAIRSEAPFYTLRLTTIPPYDSSETITERVRVVAGCLRFSRRSPETTRRHWISTWMCNPTQNLATSLGCFRVRLRLIGGQCRSSEIVSGMPKMGKNSCEQSYNLNFKDWERDGFGDALKNCDKLQASGERLWRVQNRKICLKILFEFPGFYPSPTHRNDLWLSH